MSYRVFVTNQPTQCKMFKNKCNDKETQLLLIFFIIPEMKKNTTVVHIICRNEKKNIFKTIPIVTSLKIYKNRINMLQTSLSFIMRIFFYLKNSEKVNKLFLIINRVKVSKQQAS